MLDLPHPVPPEFVAIMLADVKLARLTHDPADVDGQDDTDGYVECLRMVVAGEEERP